MICQDLPILQMMNKICGIIAEYNPLHNGHIYHIRETRRIGKVDFVVAIISGNFMQRGVPAILDKWTRGRLAVEAGSVDLVLEIPYFIATESAEYYAKGSIGILESLGVIDSVSFGSEKGSVEELKDIAKLLREEPFKYSDKLTEYIAEGMSFPKARERAVAEFLGDEYSKMLRLPNNILAVEYLKHIKSMQAITIKRQGGYHADDAGPEYPSATGIRKKILDNKYDIVKNSVPREVYEEITNNSISGLSKSMKEYFNLIRTEIVKRNSSELENIQGITEGLENKIKKEIRYHDDYKEFVSSVKSKRYTMTAIERGLNHILMSIDKKEVEEAFENEMWYTRVLALNDRGAFVLKKAKEKAGIKILNNINKEEKLPELFKYDIMASDIYNIITGKDMYKNSDFVMKPYIMLGDNYSDRKSVV